MVNEFPNLTDVLDRYRDAGPANVPGSVDADYDRVAQNAPPDALREGLAAAFRSDQTPEFPQMAAQMFGRASGAQRSQILTMLLSAVGPMVLQQILARRGGGAPAPAGRGGATTGGGGLGDILGGMLGGKAGAPGGGGGGLGDILGGMLGGGRGGQQAPQIPPEAAEQIDPHDIEEIAREAEKQDPSVIDKMSDVFSSQPQLLKVIGGAALAIALGRIASRRNTL